MVVRTNHYQDERSSREKFIEEHIGDGHVIDEFVVDKGHRNGLERHCITDNAIIIIYNEISGRLITKLLARPQQIKRYYESTGRKRPPNYGKILKLAEEHHRLGYNNI